MTASKEETSLKISTVVNYILFCFMNFDLKQQVCREVFLQLIPDKYSKVFCCTVKNIFIFELIIKKQYTSCQLKSSFQGEELIFV